MQQIVYYVLKQIDVHMSAWCICGSDVVGTTAVMDSKSVIKNSPILKFESVP
jgi:hypothetical protein